MEALLIFCVVVYAVYRSIPMLSKPWRVKVVKDSEYNNTVKVILARRLTRGTWQPADRIEIKQGIIVNTDDPREFKLRLKAAVEQAEAYEKTLRIGKNLTRKIKLPTLRKDNP